MAVKPKNSRKTTGRRPNVSSPENVAGEPVPKRFKSAPSSKRSAKLFNDTETSMLKNRFKDAIKGKEVPSYAAIVKEIMDVTELDKLRMGKDDPKTGKKITIGGVIEKISAVLRSYKKVLDRI